MSRSTFVLVALVAIGCSERAATEVLVHFEAEPMVRARAASLRVRVFASGATSATYDQRRDVTPTEARIGTVPVVPIGGDADRTFRVEGDLLEAGGALVREVASGDEGFIEHELREITLVFRDAPEGDGGIEDDGGIGGDGGGTDDGGGTCDCPCASDTCIGGECVPARRIAMVGTGADHTCAVDADGVLLCWGASADGQLGLGPDLVGAPVLTPTVVAEQDVLVAGGDNLVEPLPPFADVDPAEGHTCGRDTTGTPYCWGVNDYRRLGLGPCCNKDYLDHDRPTRLPTGGTMRQLATGTHHGCGISETLGGLLVCWGNSATGQAGEPSGNVAAPRSVSGADDWLEVTAGLFHTCGIRTVGPGALYCFGDSSNGRLGQDFMGVLQSTPQPVDGSWLHVSGGDRHTCAISTEGRAFCFGSNAEGQLGTGDMTSRPVPRELDGAHPDWSGIASGYTHSCGIRAGGRLFCWGANLTGALGVGPEPTVSASPLEVDGTWASVSTGQGYTCAITPSGHLACWGDGGSGKLGLGSLENATTPRFVCF